MKKFFLLFTSIFSASFLFAQENLIKNGSFEDWTNDQTVPASWNMHNLKNFDSDKIRRSSDIRTDGKYALNFKDAGMKHQIFQTIPVKSGEFYDISCQVKTDLSMYEFRLFYHFRSKDGKYVKPGKSSTGIPYARVKTEWKTIELKNIPVPEKANQLVVALVPNDSWSKNNTKGNIWVDNVCVRKSKDVNDNQKKNMPFCEIPLYDSLNITVDGKADEPEWNNSSVISHLVSPTVFSPVGTPTSIRLLADKEALYLFADMKRGPATVKPKQTTAQTRDKGVMNDLIEIFLRPQNGRDEQYHFMFDSIGSIWDAKQVYIPFGQPLPKNGLRVKNDSVWNANSMTVKAVDNQDSWTLEMRIPFKELAMTSPQDGSTMTANFCRADYGNGTNHNLLTAWAHHKVVAFANFEDFGTLRFKKQPVAIRKANIETTLSLAGITIFSPKPFDGRVIAEEQVSDTRKVLLGEEKIKVAANEERSFRLPLSNIGSVIWISVYDKDGTLCFRQGGLPYGTMFNIAMQDPLNVRKNALFIPNDTRWFNGFQIRHTLTGKTGNKIYGNPAKAKIIAEVPEGIQIPYVVYSNWGGDNKAKVPLKQERITKNNKRFTRYVLDAYISGVNRPLIFFTSTLKENTKGKLYLYMTWDGGAQIPVEHDFTIVSFGRVKPFERMQLRMDDLTPRMAEYLTDEPWKNLPSLGINVFRIPYSLKGGAYYDETKETAAQRYDRFIKSAKASGNKWYFCIQNDLNNALIFWCNETKWGNPLKLKPALDGRVKDIDGDDQRNQFGWYSPCPRYRGENFHKQVEGILNSDPVKKYQVTWFVLDWEFWGSPCYCDRCVKIHWPEYLKQHNLPNYGDPRAFMKNEKNNKEAVAAWKAFFESSRGSLYRDLKAELNKHLDPARKEWYAPKTGSFVLSEWIQPQKHLINSMDFFDWPYAYISPAARMNQVAQVYTDIVKASSKQIVASVNSMQGCELNEQDPPVSTYYNMLESAALGVRGFEWWFVPLMEAMSYKYIMDGLRQIRPFEDIVLDGKVTVHTEANNCSFRKVELNGEGLYCVRNYQLNQPEQVSFTVEGETGDCVYDTATGEQIAKLKDEGLFGFLFNGDCAVFHRTVKNTITLTLDEAHQAKLLYVGKNYSKRIEKVKVSAK